MEFMVVVKYPDGAPHAYFFSDALTANGFYYFKYEEYAADGTIFKGTKVQLWRMVPSGRSYELKLSND